LEITAQPLEEYAIVYVILLKLQTKAKETLFAKVTKLDRSKTRLVCVCYDQECTCLHKTDLDIKKEDEYKAKLIRKAQVILSTLANSN